MERYIGLDVGYGFVKVTDGDSGYAFPSVVGEGDLTPSLVTGYHKSQRVADLRIGIDGKVYFVGNWRFAVPAWLTGACLTLGRREKTSGCWSFQP